MMKKLIVLRILKAIIPSIIFITQVTIQQFSLKLYTRHTDT